MIIVEDMSYDSEDGDKSLWQFFDQQVAQASTKRSISSELTIEMQQYLRINNLERKQDPFEWWKRNCHLYPHVSRLVKKCLSLPGTSVPSERIFRVGQLVSEKRNRLKAKHINMLVFLNNNLHWWNKNVVSYRKCWISRIGFKFLVSPITSVSTGCPSRVGSVHDNPTKLDQYTHRSAFWLIFCSLLYIQQFCQCTDPAL